jgi:hypothetical protein
MVTGLTRWSCCFKKREKFSPMPEYLVSGISFISAASIEHLGYHVKSNMDSGDIHHRNLLSGEHFLRSAILRR